jgi:putative oxidoreductase
MKNLIALLGRIFYALPFAVFGVMHLMHAHEMAGMVPHWIPGGVIWIYVTGVAMIAACVAIITKIKGMQASLYLAILLGIFVITIHLPALQGADPHQSQMTMISLLKDISLMGAAMTYAALFANQASRG